MARAGLRVLIVEEAGEAPFFGLREPFHLGAPGPDHVLGGMLRELAVPLIDQRLVSAQPEGLQVVLPNARIDVGPAKQLSAELAAWRLSEEDESLDALRALEEAGARERRALLLSPLVRSGRRLPFSAGRIARGRAATEEEAGRGMPEALARGPAALRLLCDLLVRALGNHAARAPGPEASARLLGSALEGSYFVAGEAGLRGLLDRRLEALSVERRTLPGPLRFVSVAGQPGIAPTHREEIWSGRCLIWNAPAPALAAAIEGEVPEALQREATHRRVFLHFRTRRELLPGAMGDRIALVTDPSDPGGAGLVSLRTFAGAADEADLVASTLAPRDARPEEEMEAAVRALLPFSQDTLLRVPTPTRVWDRDGELADPDFGEGWPHEIDLRASAKPLVHHLDRNTVACLGTEGDLLLGWRAGDTLTAELS